MRLLLVEDDLTFARQVRRRLTEDGLVVDHAGSVTEGSALAGIGQYAAVLLDLQMPDGSGLEVLRLVRAANHAIPVMVISGITAEGTMIRVLGAGADDYVAKPVSLELLLARVRALLRRGGSRADEVARVGALVVDARQHVAWVAGRPLRLTPLELRLLAHLVEHAEHVQARTTLLQAVWGYQHADGSNVVDVTVGRLRRQLGEGDEVPVIEAVRGVGYVLRVPGTLAARAERAGYGAFHPVAPTTDEGAGERARFGTVHEHTDD